MSEYVYLAEGGRNLVLKYVGQEKQLIGTVLRVQKNALSDLKFKYKSFSKKFLTSLISPRFLQDAVKVEISDHFRNQINDKIKFNLKRPENRRFQEINSTVRTACILENLTAKVGQSNSDTITVEIKPKCGYLPMKQLLSYFSQNMKSSISRYQLHQVLKLKQNKLTRISEYDPLLLFSNDENKMLQALKALIKTPQNNLRVFLNGELVPPESVLTLKMLKKLVSFLKTERVLSEILDVQKLDRFDIENIHLIYKMFTENPRDLLDLNNIFEYPTLTTTKDVDQILCKLITMTDSSLVNHSNSEISVKYKEFSSCDELVLVEEIKQKKICSLYGLFAIRDFLLATSFKDCSLMIRFDSRSLEVDTIRIVDIDRKPVAKIPFYLELDERIVKEYREAIDRET